MNYSQQMNACRPTTPPAQCVTLEKMNHVIIFSSHVWLIVKQCKHSFGASKSTIIISVKVPASGSQGRGSFYLAYCNTTNHWIITYLVKQKTEKGNY